jgi:hypothetical protein
MAARLIVVGLSAAMLAAQMPPALAYTKIDLRNLEYLINGKTADQDLRESFPVQLARARKFCGAPTSSTSRGFGGTLWQTTCTRCRWWREVLVCGDPTKPKTCRTQSAAHSMSVAPASSGRRDDASPCKRLESRLCFLGREGLCPIPIHQSVSSVMESENVPASFEIAETR